MYSKIFTVCDIPDQAQHLDIEMRRQSRYGYSYGIFKDIENKMANYPNVIILLPTDGYLRANKVTEFSTVEPSLFYYFTGMNAVSVTSPLVETATFALVSKVPGQVMLAKFDNKAQLDTQIKIFAKYPSP